ncbi:MAG: hypothetical protein QOE71_1214 [Pseudonocardiales bacterium]|nr:hypothetical protein [Pseudonocardiales bacterium]
MVGVSTVLRWDTSAAAAVASRLRADSERARGCFEDFRTHSELQAAWAGGAASAAGQHAYRLAQDLYIVGDLIGLLGATIARRAADLAAAQHTVRAASIEAAAAGLLVSEDGSVSVPTAQAAVAAQLDWDARNPSFLAARLTARLTAALTAANLADADLAAAMSTAARTVSVRASNPSVISQVVRYIARPVIGPFVAGSRPPGPAEDPFLCDAVGGLETGRHPRPSDPEFGAWFSALTPAEKQQAIDRLGMTFTAGTAGEYDPFATIRGGELPAWAQRINAAGYACTGTLGLPLPGTAGHGYFGGGSVAGPGGAQWPILSPYYTDGHYVYLADGASRADGGIAQLDGHDPGWHTVVVTTGTAAFGSIGTSTAAATLMAFLSGTEGSSGRAVSVNVVTPDNVRVTRDGVPYDGGRHQAVARMPANKPYAEVVSKMSHPHDELPPQHAIKSRNKLDLGTQVLETGNAVAALGPHAQRQWWVDYQINDDGRTRAVIRTFTESSKGDFSKVIGGFGHAFPTGRTGETQELPINTRYPEGFRQLYEGPPISGDPGRHGRLVDLGLPIAERLNK